MPPELPASPWFSGTERVTDRGLQITACVINPDGTVAGWQDKGQIDPSEEATYPALGTERHVFTRRAADVRRRDLPRGLALSRNGTVGGASRRAAGVPPARARRRTRQLSPDDVRRSGQYLSREGDAVPRGGEHLLLRIGELRQRGLGHDVGGRSARTGRCSVTSRMARKGCSWPTWTSAPPLDCSLLAAVSRLYSAIRFVAIILPLEPRLFRRETHGHGP